MKLRLPLGDENRFLAQLSADARDSSTLFLILDGYSDVELSKSERTVSLLVRKTKR